MKSFLLVVILALLLQCQGVPIEDFFMVEGSSSPHPNQQMIGNLATDCGAVSHFSVCFASHILFNFQATSLAM